MSTEPLVSTYYIVTRAGDWRSSIDDEGRELRFATPDEAERELHEYLVAGIEAHVEKVERVQTIVRTAHSMGPLEERLDFWCRWWSRYAKSNGGRGRPTVRMHFECAKHRLDDYKAENRF